MTNKEGDKQTKMQSENKFAGRKTVRLWLPCNKGQTDQTKQTKIQSDKQICRQKDRQTLASLK